MAERATGEDRLILIELGGNDLIAGETSTAFSRALDAILAKLAAPERTLVMDRVWLIPKRFLAGVIAGRDATSDGLHLTDAGARRMEAVVSRILAPVLRTRLDKPTVLATHP